MKNESSNSETPTESVLIEKPESTKTSLQTRKQPSQEDLERIKPRLVELISLLLESMSTDMQQQEQPDPQMSGLVAMGPLIQMMINNYETGKLRLLLTCLSEIGKAVLDWDCSQEQYEDAVVPYIQGLQEALS